MQHEPVTVLIADFQNQTNDSTFDRTLEPMLKIALEGAGFITAFDRNSVVSIGVRPPEKLDEASARQIAVNQALGVVLSGSVQRQGSGYGIALKASRAMTDELIANVSGRASSKDQVLGVATRLASDVREALGDDTSDAAKQFATDRLSATSLDVVRYYAAGTAGLHSNKPEEALRNFQAAVEVDPKFGFGYYGLAIASRNLDRHADAEKYIAEAIKYIDSMTDRERFRTRGFSYRINGEYRKCVDEYSALVERYAADVGARNQVALCSAFLRELPKAVEEMREAVRILPKRALYRENLALYLNYASDFPGAEKEARLIENPGVFGVLALAFAQLGQNQLPQAQETYTKVGAIDSQGASYAASGLADLAVYEGRFADAVKILEAGVAADLASKESDRAAAKFTALAQARLLSRQTGPAITAAENALKNSQLVKIRFLAARVFVEAGQIAKAQKLAADLGSEVQAEPRAHAKIIEGLIALKRGNRAQAIAALNDANTLQDTWIGRFDLGRVYLEANQFLDADSEFDRCIRRRGEALSLFLDEEPTFGYLPPLYYYLGRVREGMKTTGYADSYRTYLTIRGKSTEDPLLPEVRRRAGVHRGAG